MEENSRVGEATGRRGKEIKEDWERKKQLHLPNNVTHAEGFLLRQTPWGDFS